MRALPTLAMILLTASPLAAQQQITFEQAVHANVTLGLQLCMVNGIQSGPAWAAMIRQAGFGETVQAEANGDTTHTFTAPANTMRITLYYGNMPEECLVESDHLGVGAASQLLDQVVPQLRPGYRRMMTQGAVNPATGQPATCVRYEDPANEIGEVIGVYGGKGAQACVENGSSVLFNGSRV